MCMKRSKRREERDGLIIVVGSIMILIGLALVALAIIYAKELGWWLALGIGLAGLTTGGAAVMSIVTNNRAWILIDLILPG